MRDFETKRLKGTGEAPTVALNAKGIEMKEQGIDVLSFAAGEPDFDTPAILTPLRRSRKKRSGPYATTRPIIPLQRASQHFAAE